MVPYKAISYNISACNCPHCGAYAELEWSTCTKFTLAGGKHIGQLRNFALSMCYHCGEHSVWLNQQLIYPFNCSAPLPNPDLPEEIIRDFNEARNIVELSPRGAVALLRLAVQKMCKHLGQKGENINEDIKQLVSQGLPDKMQKALDSVRVIGNNAVHPGQIDLTDDRESAYKLFGFINIICDILITQPKQIDEFYDLKIPESAKEAIEKRDKK